MTYAHQYRFASFVDGPATAPAVAAARAAAVPGDGPGHMLVIRGDGGLGKTHLLRAIVNEARARRLRATYATASQLMNRLRRDPARLDAAAAWLGPARVVAVDEVEDLAGHRAGVSELGRLLRDLVEQGRHVVLGTSGDLPGEIVRRMPADARVVELGPPDVATRLRIVRDKMQRLGLTFSADVVQAVAERCAQSVRQLEAALVRLGAYAFIVRTPITRGEAEEVLDPVIRPRRTRAARPRRRRALRIAAPAPPPAEEVLAGIRELVEFVREVGGGRIGYPDVRGCDVFVRLEARDGERYVLRMRTTAYLVAPLRCTFVDERYRWCETAWPEDDILGPFCAPDFICMPPVAEFYACHPDHAYRRGDGSFTNTVAAVFAALQADEYTGRFKGRG